MANMEQQDNTTRAIEIINPIFDARTFTAAGADVYLAGTVLARNTASGKLVVFVDGGAAGAEIPTAVLTQEVETTGAGDITIRPLLSGQVRVNDLIEHGSGAVTPAAAEDLRAWGITPMTTDQLTHFDNA